MDSWVASTFCLLWMWTYYRNNCPSLCFPFPELESLGHMVISVFEEVPWHWILIFSIASALLVLGLPWGRLGLCPQTDRQYWDLAFVCPNVSCSVAPGERCSCVLIPRPDLSPAHTLWAKAPLWPSPGHSAPKTLLVMTVGFRERQAVSSAEGRGKGRRLGMSGAHWGWDCGPI